jgi:hypothetical protein
MKELREFQEHPDTNLYVHSFAPLFSRTDRERSITTKRTLLNSMHCLLALKTLLMNTACLNFFYTFPMVRVPSARVLIVDYPSKAPQYGSFRELLTLVLLHWRRIRGERDLIQMFAVFRSRGIDGRFMLLGKYAYRFLEPGVENQEKNVRTHRKSITDSRATESRVPIRSHVDSFAHESWSCTIDP